jgi:hypothetical protein
LTTWRTLAVETWTTPGIREGARVRKSRKSSFERNTAVATMLNVPVVIITK